MRFKQKKPLEIKTPIDGFAVQLINMYYSNVLRTYPETLTTKVEPSKLIKTEEGN